MNYYILMRYLLHRTYSRYLIAFLQVIRFPADFGHLFKEKYIDLDMQDDLERSEIINWCRTTKPVLALRTTGLFDI